jgi:hypothetical protein
MAGDDLKPHHDGLGDDQDGDGPMQRTIQRAARRGGMGNDAGVRLEIGAVERHARMASSHEPTPRARPSVSHNRSAARRKTLPSIS